MAKKVTEKLVYLDEKGDAHPYRSWAEHANVRREMVEGLMGEMRISFDGAQDILNWLSSRAKEVREYLDACDAMQREVLESGEKAR